jgi:hypothetical protein
MNINRLLILGVITLLGCDSTDKQPIASAKQIDTYSTKIRNYIKENIDKNYYYHSKERGFEVVDSVKLSVLNSIIYKVDLRSTFDDDDYFLIQDCVNEEVYTIINRGWPSHNSETERDIQVKILETNASGKDIELVNYDYLGLETFLNRSSVLKLRPISDMEFDTIIRFMGDNRLTRITKLEELDTLISKINTEENNANGKLEHDHLLSIKPLLLKKIKHKNVFLYRSYWDARLEYFEILPYVSTSICGDKKEREKAVCEKEVLYDYNHTVKGGFYNIKIMTIR